MLSAHVAGFDPQMKAGHPVVSLVPISGHALPMWLGWVATHPSAAAARCLIKTASESFSLPILSVFRRYRRLLKRLPENSQQIATRQPDMHIVCWVYRMPYWVMIKILYLVRFLLEKKRTLLAIILKRLQLGLGQVNNLVSSMVVARQVVSEGRRLGSTQWTTPLQVVTHRFGRISANRIGMRWKCCHSTIRHREIGSRVGQGLKHRMSVFATGRVPLT